MVAEVLVLDWKGRREWGYSYACQNMQVMGAGVGGGPACWSGELVLVLAKMVLGQWAMRLSWQIKDSGDMNQAADGARKRWPPGPMFTPTQPCLLPRCNGAQNRGSDGEWRGMMTTFSHLMGQVGVGEAINLREEREGGRAERWHARSGDREGHGMRSFGCSVVRCCEIM